MPPSQWHVRLRVFTPAISTHTSPIEMVALGTHIVYFDRFVQVLGAGGGPVLEPEHLRGRELVRAGARHRHAVDREDGEDDPQSEAAESYPD